MILEGKVIDAETKEPLFGANVFISNSNGIMVDPPVGSPTDPDGEYFFEGGKVGDFISVSYMGYKTKTKKINSETAPINWEIEPTTASIPEFTVVAERDEPKTQSVARKDKNYTPFIVGGIVLLALVGGYITYQSIKHK